MDRIERIRAAIRGEKVDRVPTGFWSHFPAHAVTGMAMAEAHLDFYRRSEVDFIKVMNDNPYRLDGVSRIDRPRDWRKLRPEPLDSPVRKDYLDGLKRILDAAGHEALIIVTIFNPFSTANDNRSGTLDFSDADFRAITADLREDPVSTFAGLKIIAESLAVFAERCVETGAAGVFFSANGGDTDRFNAEAFDQWIGTTDRMVLDAVRATGAEFNLLHVCGYNQRLASYADYPVDVVNWAPQMRNPSLKEGAKILGRTVLGGMSQVGPLASGLCESIEQEVHQVLDEFGAERLILGAGCAVSDEARPENFAVAREAALTWCQRSVMSTNGQLNLSPSLART